MSLDSVGSGSIWERLVGRVGYVSQSVMLGDWGSRC